MRVHLGGCGENYNLITKLGGEFIIHNKVDDAEVGGFGLVISLQSTVWCCVGAWATFLR